jgi:hypothetical protein
MPGMNRAGIISFQADRQLRRELRSFRERMVVDLGRPVPESEVVRILLRQGLQSGCSLQNSGYIEGYRSGASTARAAFEAGAAAVARRRL